MPRSHSTAAASAAVVEVAKRAQDGTPGAPVVLEIDQRSACRSVLRDCVTEPDALAAHEVLLVSSAPELEPEWDTNLPDQLIDRAVYKGADGLDDTELTRLILHPPGIAAVAHLVSDLLPDAWLDEVVAAGERLLTVGSSEFSSRTVGRVGEPELALALREGEPRSAASGEQHFVSTRLSCDVTWDPEMGLLAIIVDGSAVSGDGVRVDAVWERASGGQVRGSSADDSETVILVPQDGTAPQPGDRLVVEYRSTRRNWTARLEVGC